LKTLEEIFDVENKNVNIRHSCRESGCFILQSPDFQAMTKDCFLTSSSKKIRPGDRDAEVEVRLTVTDHRTLEVERKSHFLIFESKKPHDTTLLDKWDGQRRTLEAKAKQGSAVIVIYHEKPDGSDIRAMQVWNVAGYRNGDYVRGDLTKFRAACKMWFNTIEGGAFAPGPLESVCRPVEREGAAGYKG
jgi:hypothetical protein